MAKRQSFVVGSTNSITQTLTSSELNHGFDQYEILTADELDGVFNAVSDYSNDSSNEIANAIQSITGSQPTGATQTELAGALNKLRQDIETSSLTFKGYIATSAPSSSTYGLVEGNLWINSATLPTLFPVAATNIKEWNGTAWVTQSNTYTATDFDFWRNVNDNEGYYWFGGQWVVMSTDMSTTYFTLNQTSGKWEIKTDVNLPGKPTAATPTNSAGDTQIANVKYVKDSVNMVEPDIFDWKWADHILSNSRWLPASGFAWHAGTEYTTAYQHLVADGTVPLYAWGSTSNPNYTTSATPAYNDPIYDFHNGALRRVDYVKRYDAETNYIYDFQDYGYARKSSKDLAHVVVPNSTETIAGTTIQFYLAADGHKICPASEESNIAAVFSSTGVAWYYILDVDNQRFKLPRTEHNVVGFRDVVGKYVAPGLPDHSHEYTVAVRAGGNQGGAYAGTVDLQTGTTGLASASNVIYGNGTTVQPPATQMYLYFYPY